jgi:hypothetical protein
MVLMQRSSSDRLACRCSPPGLVVGLVAPSGRLVVVSFWVEGVLFNFKGKQLPSKLLGPPSQRRTGQGEEAPVSAGTNVEQVARVDLRGAD